MFKLLSALVLALAVVSHAAPVEKRGAVQCKPVAQPDILSGWIHGEYSTGFQMTSKPAGDGYYDLYQDKGATSKFQLYECEAPSEKFGTSSDKAYFGQLRSADRPDFCLTSGYAVVPDGEQWDKSPKFKYDPDENNGITLRSCSAENDFTMRLQWFSLEKNPSCAPTLKFEAYKTDETLKNIFARDNATFFDFPGKDPQPMVTQLASKSKKCDA